MLRTYYAGDKSKAGSLEDNVKAGASATDLRTFSNTDSLTPYLSADEVSGSGTDRPPPGDKKRRPANTAPPRDSF